MNTFSHQISKIPDIRLNDGNLLPVLGIATSTDSYNQTRDTLQLGIRHIDVTKSEDYIGVAHSIKNSGLPRSQVFITARAPFLADLSQALDDALQALDLPCVDLFLMELEPYKHEWQLTIAWWAMEEIKMDKRARSIGVAGMGMEDLSIIVKKAGRFLPVVNQVELHPFCQRTELLQWSKLQGIVTATYGPLDSVAGKAMKELASTHADNIILNTAVAYEVSVPAIILKWIALSGVIIVTTSTTSRELEAQMKMFEIGLTNNDFEGITAAGLYKLEQDTIKAKAKAENLTIKKREGAKEDGKGDGPREKVDLEDMPSLKKEESCVRNTG
ncbi:Aldo/keto reductase [Cadophora sp. DSE1049]|nr:Aldo/keto reductase [Cadophora sp. DSE1049]